MQVSTESGRNQPRFGAGRFPDPTVMNAGISSTDVENGDGSYEVKNVLWSSSGSYYEFSIVIKKSIYGLVVRANVLEPVSSDVFRRTGRDVAIKVCAKDVLLKNSGVSLENPITEIGAMQDFGEPRHPNIATQFECCVDDKNIYSVLKFQPGVELFDHILNNGPLNEVAARCMFQQLMLAVFRLQWRDIGHRDISLENIMYNAADHATVLIDFGLCVKLQRDPENSTEYFKIPNAACGKSYYMPPESAWDERSLRLVNPLEGDIWSAGMCLLYALLGFPPIERACEDDVRYRYLTQGRLSELLDHWEVSLSSELVDLLQLILQAEPGDRPSVQQILQHSWMQRDGPPCPYQNEVSPDELAAALGYSASRASALPPLQPPALHHGGCISSDNRDMECSMDTMDTIDEDDGNNQGDMNSDRTLATNMNLHMNMHMSVNTDDATTRESDLLSYRSSVESRWSCGTTPTSSYTLPLSSAANGEEEQQQQQRRHPQSTSSSSGIGIDSSECSSGVDSGAATPTTNHHQHQHQHIPQQSNSADTGDYSIHNTLNTNQKPNTILDASTNASTTVLNSTNKTSRNNSSAANAPNSNFTGYHTRSQSFGKANINYAV